MRNHHRGMHESGAARFRILCLALALACAPAAAGKLDLGVGVGMSDATNTGGADFIAGYQQDPAGDWSYGGNLHVLDAVNFSSVGVYATAQPQYRWLHFLQFKAGLIYADRGQEYANQPFAAYRGAGPAFGLGIVADAGESVQVHIFDMQHGTVAGHSFMIYSLNIVVAIGGLGGILGGNR
jgi:hypothetical protein